MMIEELIAVKNFRHFAVSALLCLCSLSASAGLFDDDQARRAILDMRQRIDAVRVESEQKMNVLTEDNALLRRSLIDIQNQIQSLRSDMAALRGLNEQLSRDVSNLQLKQKDISQGVDERLRQFEPTKVTIDGREFMAAPSEKRDYESALAIFRKGDFPAAEVAFLDSFKRYPDSGYELSALFWLANAQYATRSYKESMLNFRALISKDSEHLRAPEAVLSIANCQVELKDTRGARKTLTDLIKAYPKSEAAVAAKERLLRLK